MAYSLLPIDRGWAWVILGGTSMINMVSTGCVRSFGLIYTEFLDYFQTGAGDTAWVFGVNFCLLLGSASLGPALAQFIGYRSVIMIGSGITCLGYVTSAFVPNMRFLYLTYGVIIGLGLGLTFTPIVIMVSIYFNKRRSLANGITLAGSGVGYFLFPFVIRYLIDTYTLFGTMILLGGITLNSCVGAALLRPLDSFKVSNRTMTNGGIDKNTSDTHAHENDAPSERRETDKNIAEKSKNSSGKTTCCNILSKAAYNATSIYDFTYLRNPEYLLYLIGFCLASMGLCHVFIVVPAFAVDCGASKDKVALLVSLGGLSDTIGRICVGWFSDLTFVPKKLVFIGVMLCGGSAALLAPLATSFVPLAIYTCWYGLFGGSYWVLIAPMLADRFGVEKLPGLFGLTVTFMSIPYLLAPPILGWAKDATESWAVSFWLAGIWMILAAVSIILQHLFIRSIKKRQETLPVQQCTEIIC